MGVQRAFRRTRRGPRLDASTHRLQGVGKQLDSFSARIGGNRLDWPNNASLAQLLTYCAAELRYVAGGTRQTDEANTSFIEGWMWEVAHSEH